MNAPDTQSDSSVDLRRGPSTFKRYLFAVVSISIAFAIRWSLNGLLRDNPQKHVFITFVVAITFTAWYSGFVPSILAFIGGFLLADFFFIDPHNSFSASPSTFFQVIIPPALACITIIMFGHSMHLARDKANANADEAINNAKKLELEVAERKRAEEQVRRLNGELEERVQLRTAELLASNQELESFTYSVSHDLRAPLRHVDGYAQMLVEDFGPQIPAEALALAHKIRRGSQNMGKLVDDLLNLSRVGKQALSIRHVALDSLVTEALAEIKPEIGERRIEWKIANLPSVDGDPGLLRLVFVNLLSNAVKYSRPREVAMIEVGEQLVNGEKAFFVRDNGVGFNMKYAGKLFGVFQRLHRAEEFEGTGVGLATVARIVRKHGGRIWADAEANKGATFFFTLPATQKPNVSNNGHSERIVASEPVGAQK